MLRGNLRCKKLEELVHQLFCSLCIINDNKKLINNEAEHCPWAVVLINKKAVGDLSLQPLLLYAVCTPLLDQEEP